MLPRMEDTIIVGYDDTELSRKALDRAIEEARQRNGRLVVIAVEEMPLDPADPRNFGTLDDGPVESGSRRHRSSSTRSPAPVPSSSRAGSRRTTSSRPVTPAGRSSTWPRTAMPD
jgi:nucleotide-binding universal stress UspA family protein